MVTVEGADATDTLTLRNAVLRANEDGLSGSFLANPLPGEPAGGILVGGFEGNVTLLNSLVAGNTVGPPSGPPAFDCAVRTQRDGVFPSIEWNILSTCNRPVASAQLTFPSGLAVIAFLPSSCVPGNNILICSGLNAPAGSPFEIDARFNTAFPPGASFSSFFTATDGATLTVDGTGP